MLPARDTALVQIVDAALADATARAVRPDGTSWLACRPGCTPCCHGVFRISALDAARLRDGLQRLAQDDPAKAAVLAERTRRLVHALEADFPGHVETGALVAEDDPAWEHFADLPEAEGPCPVLDPATGRCSLYAARPMTCRVFGPPVLNEGGIGMCELCYAGASEAEVLHGEMHLTHHELEERLASACEGPDTVIAWALLQG